MCVWRNLCTKNRANNHINSTIEGRHGFKCTAMNLRIATETKLASSLFPKLFIRFYPISCNSLNTFSFQFNELWNNPMAESFVEICSMLLFCLQDLHSILINTLNKKLGILFKTLQLAFIVINFTFNF